MKKISKLLCVLLVGMVGSTAFAGTVGVPYTKVKVVQPRIVQKAVVAPTAVCEPVVVAAPCVCVKVVQPRVVQRSVVMMDCCDPQVAVDSTRLAKVTTVFPRVVKKGVVATPCACEPLVDTGTARLAKVKVVYPRTVRVGVVAPACCGCP